MYCQDKSGKSKKRGVFFNMEYIYSTLHKLRIKRTYQGYYHLATAIQLVIEKEERLLYIHKWLYQEVALIHNTSPFCVERNIRTVKSNFWNNGDRRIFEIIAGCPIEQMPSNSEFIDILSCYIKEKNIIIHN